MQVNIKLNLIGVSLLFNLALYFLYGKGYIPNTELSGGEAALEFLTGYIIEKSLSMDNIFVMAAIFGYFKIPKIYQHRVLFWGILGAIIFRGVFVIGGAALLHHFEWIMYVFGALLIFSALKMLFSKEDEEQDLSQNTVVKLAKKFFPITTKIEGHAFFLKENGKLFFLDRPLEMLITTSDRPLSSNKSDLEKRYNERYNLYKVSADVVIDASGTVEDVINQIMKVTE